MGKSISLLTKPFRNFNLENRAHKVISKDKPAVAPRHLKDQLHIDQIIKEYPDVYADSLKKHEGLDGHLRSVFVTSQDPVPEIKKEIVPQPERSLPQSRIAVEDYEYGFKEPEAVPLGRVTLRGALEFITGHQLEPHKYTVGYIAENYKLPESTVQNILKHYRMFEIYLPQERESKATFAGPGVPRVEIIRDIRKHLGPGLGRDEK